MARYLIALVAVLACSIVTTTAFGSPKGFYVGGGLASRTATGDLDGKSVLVNSAGDHGGAVGKLENGSGPSFDIGYNFNTHFGVEYLESTTVHTAKHQNEASSTVAGIGTGMIGVRLSAGMGDHFDVFARVGYVAASVSYLDYGHQGSFSPVFSPTSDETFSLSGSGYGWGVGMEMVFGKHLGFGLGYTVYNVKFDEGDVGGTKIKITKSQPSATFATPDFTVLWHF